MRKKNLLIIGGVTLSVIVGGILVANSDSSKINKVKRISEQHKNGQIETSIAIEEMRRVKDSIEDKETKDEIQAIMSKLSKYHNGRTVLDETREAIDNNIIKKNGYGKEGKEHYIARIERYIDEDSELYEEAQAILSELGSYKQKSLGLEYSKAKSTAGLQKVRIKVTNNTGKDIAYIRVDMFEQNSKGNIVNSDFTNSNSIIKDGATAYIETYYDFVGSETKLNLEATNIRYR